MLTFARAGKVLYGAAFASVMVFGATEVRAAPQSSACPFNPPAGQVGACSSQAACSSTCLSYFPENGGTGICRNGCCLCAT